MKKVIFLTVMLLATVGRVPAQSDLPTIGSLADIKGLSKVYVAADTEARNMILKHLKKQPSFTIVDKPEDAEFFLEYKPIARNTSALVWMSIHSETGQLDAYVSHDGKKVIAWSESTTGGAFKADTPRRLIEKFLKRVKEK